MHNMLTGVIEIDDFPPVTFKIGSGETKSDREWLKKKKEYYDKVWNKNGPKILTKIEDLCGDSFPKTAKQTGITVLLHKKTPKNPVSSFLSEQSPLEVNLFLNRNDTTASLKDLLVRMLVHSFIHQQYEYRFRIRELTLFEDILADELVTSKISFMVMGRKLGRANCAKALSEAVEQTVYRISEKQARDKLVDLAYKFFQESTAKNKQPKTDILTSREELILLLLELLPKTVINE
ncbi:MAG: hypothetical protein NWE92_02895 [Candidatus Bathyarchaeota archaeon]|nr:hypothetical protein [Candidatus Bathyarchaeota archaeon]